VDFIVELRHKKVHSSAVQYLSLLSGPLNFKLQCAIRTPLLNKHDLFYQYNKVSSASMGQLCSLAMRETNYAKNDLIFSAGEEASYMYFVSNGASVYRKVSVSKRTTPEKLEESQWCVEQCLWYPWLHVGSMWAISYSDIVTIDAAKFSDVSGADYGVLQLCRGRAYYFWDLQRSGVVLTDLPANLRYLRSKNTAESFSSLEVKDAEDTEMLISPRAQ